jgi:hypothetical protein
VRASSQVRRGGLRLFCAPGAIIPGSGPTDLEKSDVKVLENDTEADAQISRSGVSYVEDHKHSLRNSILLSLNVQSKVGVGARMKQIYNRFKMIRGWKPKVPFV